MPWPHGKFWENGEKLAQLRALASEGIYTAQELADKLGCSRSSIIGKTHREKIPLMSLSNAYIAAQPRRIASRAAKKAMLEPRPIPLSPSSIPSRNLDMMELRDGLCRYPRGTNPPYSFCGYPVEAGKPYCSQHCALVFQKPVARMR